ncbi:MAG TPA: A/G-specific adenine glycosylase [Casimicrobiaceae bacterium]|nr:A/G-specific adenine glycosylase [Casimicrobiaceae bacterium]
MQERASFAARIVAWQHAHGRHDLPWQTRDAYRVWLSEIMLQQTQVATVLPYYERFVAAFPDVRSLAAAPLERVLEQWSGLGYYRRAHHLHAAAKIIVERHGGEFPRDWDALAALPGIGRSTASAIASLAFGINAAILDGNVKRVLARHRGVEGYPGTPAVQRALWVEAESLAPDRDIETYTQGMMDVGATVCTRTRPLCEACPVASDCVARRERRVDELPSPRPPKIVPRRETRVLVIERAGEMLFERRPPTGVWAGLWSLPEVPVDVDVALALEKRFGFRAKHREQLAPIVHGFTHFTLTMHVERIEVATRDQSAREVSYLWVTRADALGAALPAPIKRLVRSLEAAAST